ncbi:MAG: type II toxin-antitoxin system Phd/YefM family antitoxin [Deltaproteobacteria bacterium]|nr:type II toxin-antitoxin system Phd/YefM family antitoxin [Deltaproteobacteria bacterium]
MDEIRESPLPYGDPAPLEGKLQEPTTEMETLSVSEFKATCLGVLERVRATGRSLLITKRGQPLAQVLPPPMPEVTAGSAFGCMQGTCDEIGDILEPLPEKDWEVLG